MFPNVYRFLFALFLLKPSVRSSLVDLAFPPSIRESWNSTRWFRDFWQQQGVPLEFTNLLKNSSFFLLEASLLVTVHSSPPNCNPQTDECSDRLRDLKWKFNLTASKWDKNWLTVGVPEKEFRKVNLSPFVETHQVTCPCDNQPLHLFYENPTKKLHLHLVVFKEGDKQGDFTVCPISKETRALLGRQFEDFTDCLAFINFTTTTQHVVLLPADIPAYLSALPSLQYPPNRERVAAVDTALRLLARNSAESTVDYVHPQASEIDLLSHNSSTTQLMKSASQLARAQHLSLDISSPCSGNYGLNLTLLVLVFNRAADFTRRQAIRATYGGALQNSPHSELYFVIAKPEDSSTQAKILVESVHHGDLIQVDYTESYYNCTVKAVALLRWTALHCPLVKWMLKLDDDSFLRPHPLLNWLSRTSPNRAIGGTMPEGSRVLRTGTWGLSRRYYPGETYPAFLTCTYLLPGYLTVKLYEAVLGNLPAIPFEDVYVTGVLAGAIGLPRMVSGHVRYLGQIRPQFDTREMGDVYLTYDNFDSALIQHYWKVWQ